MSCVRLSRLALVLGLALVSLSSLAADQPPEPEASLLQVMAEAEDALQANELQIAESRYRTALLEGWLIMGSLEVARGDLESARARYETAATVSAETRIPRLLISAVHLKTGRPVESIRLLRDIIRGNTKDPEARRLLAQSLAANGQLTEAVQELEELRALFPDDLEVLYLLAAAHLMQENVAAAEPIFSDLAERRPIPQTHVLIGRTYRDFSQFELARAALETALELDPQVKRAHFYLGSTLFMDGGKGALPEAIVEFQAELLVSPEDPNTNLQLGLALVEERRQEEAIPHLEIASHTPEAEKDALHTLGSAYLRVGRDADAVAALTRALEIAEAEAAVDPDKSVENQRERMISQLHYRLGLALRNLGEKEAAAVHFEAAKTSFAREFENSQERLRRYLENDAAKQRLEAFSSPLEAASLHELSPEQRYALHSRVSRLMAQAYMNLGVLQAQAQHFSRAGDLFEQAANLQPGFPNVQYSLGVTRFNGEQFDQATDPLARALDLDPDNLPLRRMLALAWLNSDHHEEATELLATDPERGTDRALQYAYGVALSGSGRTAEAARLFEELLEKYHDWPELNVILAQAYAKQDNYAAAVETLKAAIELQPDVAEAHSTLGDIYLREGKLEEAERELRTELEHHPDDARARYFLATVLDLAARADEAQEVLAELLEDTPGHANARYLLGKILLAEGQPEQAVIQLEAAARLVPSDPETYYQLGLALQRQGRADEARAAFATFQALKKDKK